jgi:hypothetical protein
MDKFIHSLDNYYDSMDSINYSMDNLSDKKDTIIAFSDSNEHPANIFCKKRQI